MVSFTFRTTPTIQARPGASGDAGAVMAGLGCRSVLVVTDRDIRAFGLVDAALASFEAAGLAFEIFDAVVADPPEAVVSLAAEAARRADGVFALGGGSALDVAKLAAVLGHEACAQPIAEMYGVDQVRGERLPLVLVPTTAGTGSEVTPISIVTTGNAEKKGVVSPQLLPDVALLDADLTLGLPAAVTAATGIDAMVHAIEAFTSRHRKNPISDCLAREALRLLGGNIRRACVEPGDREARGAMLTGSMLAGMAFANAPVAAVHALAYPLGGHFHVPHGLSNALVLPHVLAFNMPAAREAYGELAPIIFPDLVGDPGAADRLPERFAALGPELGMASRLGDVGVGHNHLPRLAEDAMKQTRLLVNNPRELTEADALAIYQAAL